MPAPQVDFYVLSALTLIPTLIEQCFMAGVPLFVFCDSQEAAAQLDEALWTSHPASFIPHAMQPDNTTSIQIGWEAPQGLSPNTRLLNHSPQVPPFYANFSHLIEVIPPDAALKQLGRERYRYYQTQGCTLHTHHLNGPHA